MSFPLFFFFFNVTASTEIYTLSLHDALPISLTVAASQAPAVSSIVFFSSVMPSAVICVVPNSTIPLAPIERIGARSEEHTSELQSRLHLVCRLLLEKKNKNTRINYTKSCY